jgi:riboflavin kinase/FMN adenylyltransferase
VPELLTTIEERLALQSGLGIDQALLIPFDLAFSRTPAPVLMDEILSHRLQARSVYVGSSYTFGHLREGTARRLIEWGRERAIAVTLVPAVLIDGEPVSSSRIRGALHEGLVDEAARLLGRDYSLRGRVEAGAGRGRTLGFPTANLAVDSPRKILPHEGVYATIVEAGGRRYGGATNVGRRPTFAGTGLTVETHLLDFSAHLVGASIVLYFVRRLRGERAFSGPDALARQIGQDVAQVRELLASARPGYNTVVQDIDNRRDANGAHAPRRTA